MSSLSSRWVKRPTWLGVLAVLGLGSGLLWAHPAAAAGPGDGGLYFGVQSASAAPELAVSFEEAAVAVSDVTPGGDVAFFSVARVPLGYVQKVVRFHRIEVADALGEARFDLDDPPVPLKSVWAVIDLSTGAYAVAAPDGFHLHEIPFPGKAFEVGAPGVVNRLRNATEELDMLVARPTVGVWTLRAWDRSPNDHDGKDNGNVLTSLGDLQPLDPAWPDPPETFAKNDVVVVILPETLRYYATRLLGPPEGTP